MFLSALNGRPALVGYWSDRGSKQWQALNNMRGYLDLWSFACRTWEKNDSTSALRTSQILRLLPKAQKCTQRLCNTQTRWPFWPTTYLTSLFNFTTYSKLSRSAQFSVAVKSLLYFACLACVACLVTHRLSIQAILRFSAILMFLSL